MIPGDLVLYKSQRRWYEEIITKATHGPYVHVAIASGTNYVLAATVHGIAYDVLPPAVAQQFCTIVPLQPFITEAGRTQGLSWAKAQVGREYGWLDIMYQALKFLAPNNSLRFGVEGHYDCSDFATRYLQHAGVALPDEYSDPYANSPNDLARYFQLIPLRKETHAKTS